VLQREQADHRAARRCATLCLAALGACSRQAPPSERWLEVDQVRPEKNFGVFLNERIQLHFSEPLDPTSVNARSVRIRSSKDVLARGEWQVEEDNLIFVPEQVLDFDLSDGGFQPGVTYFVELAGFPRPDGLRGRSGSPLEHNLRWEFRTVAVTEPRDFMFEDSSPSSGLPLTVHSTNIAPGDPILLDGQEPLDPSTLYSEDFVLQLERLGEQKPGATRPPLSEPIALRARMLSNEDKSVRRGITQIELTPFNHLLEPGKYFLRIDRECRLRDFGGNRVQVWVMRGAQPSPRLEIVVEKRESSVPGISSEFLENFLDDHMRSLEALPDCDGTAWWGNSGRLEVRWPAAAGCGAAGAVTLGSAESRRDIEATRLSVPESVRCEIDPGPGLCVLRAQGKLTIEGTLARRASAARESAPPLDGREFFERGDTLSHCLQRMRAADFNATILIAGGDLVIDGHIECDGPLVLVAGGRIRAARSDRVGARWLYYAGDGGSSLTNEAIDLLADCALVLDAPSANPLVENLRYGIVSRSIPPEGRAVRWHVAPQIRGHGAVRVRYAGERVTSDASGPREVVVDDPGALTDCPTLRLRIVLTLWSARMWRAPSLSTDSAARFSSPCEPGKWDPPWVDYVLLELDQAPRGSR
jgi:hypothetical protein